MAGMDKSVQRVIAVIALLIVAAWALRGYIPGSEPSADRERPPTNPASLAVVMAMLTVAVAIMAFAVIVRMRDRKPRAASAGDLPRGSGAVGRPTWRFSLIALAAVIGWLVLVALLARTQGPGPIEQPASDSPASSESTTPPAPDREATPPDPPAAPEAESNVIDYLIPPMLVLMTLIVVGTAIASRRQRRVAPYYSTDEDVVGERATPAAADSLARAAEVGLAEIGDLSREPREAIIACYAAMERELTRVPGAVPQDFDTPSEVLARAVDHHALRADSATELVELFEEARFSPHVMTEAHRDAAVRVLERVLAEIPRAGSVA
jgi:Domain of unknown function (DUF4129)